MLFVAGDAQKTPTAQGVQPPLPAVENDPAVHMTEALPAGHAKPAGHVTELFVAAVGQRTPAEQGGQAVAVAPPPEYEPAAQILVGRPLPGQAEPAGQGAVFELETYGQSNPGEHGARLVPLPAQKLPATHGSAGSAPLLAQ